MRIFCSDKLDRSCEKGQTKEPLSMRTGLQAVRQQTECGLEEFVPHFLSLSFWGAAHSFDVARCSLPTSPLGNHMSLASLGAIAAVLMHMKRKITFTSALLTNVKSRQTMVSFSQTTHKKRMCKKTVVSHCLVAQKISHDSILLHASRTLHRTVFHTPQRWTF